jgi:hypothetical protein
MVVAVVVELKGSRNRRHLYRPKQTERRRPAVLEASSSLPSPLAAFSPLRRWMMMMMRRRWMMMMTARRTTGQIEECRLCVSKIQKSHESNYADRSPPTATAIAEAAIAHSSS